MIHNKILTEKYRPTSLETLISKHNKVLKNYIDHPLAMPSMIFYSSSAGTGKTSAAKVLIATMGCDSLCINSSDERGIDIIRDKIKVFARSVANNLNAKRCVFLDEADGLTKQAQDSLKNLMEACSNNCFFLLSCNDLTKIIEPIRSRCVTFNFQHMPKDLISLRLKEIAKKESISISDGEIFNIINRCYPDIREMITSLQSGALGLDKNFSDYSAFLKLIKSNNLMEIQTLVYDGFDMMGFTRWMFALMFKNCEKVGYTKVSAICKHLADIEKHYNIGCNLEVIFLSNILNIIKIIKGA